jgi:hypothetical protein
MTPEQHATVRKGAQAKKASELTALDAAAMGPVTPGGTPILTTPRGTPMIGDFAEARTPKQREAAARKAAADSEAKLKKQGEQKTVEQWRVCQQLRRNLDAPASTGHRVAGTILVYRAYLLLLGSSTPVCAGARLCWGVGTSQVRSRRAISLGVRLIILLTVSGAALTQTRCSGIPADHARYIRMRG